VNGHRCKRWGDRREHCVFSRESWHTQDQLDEGDSWEDLDPDYHPRNTTVPAWTEVGARVYRSLLDSYGTQPLPNLPPIPVPGRRPNLAPRPQRGLRPAYVPQYIPLYNRAVGLAEIGVIEHLPREGATLGRSLGKSYRQYWEYGETFAWVISTAAGIAVGNLAWKMGRSKGGAFQTRSIWGGLFNKSPLWSVTRDVTQQLEGGYVAEGMDVVKERQTFGEVKRHGRNAANQNAWADPGLG
jgi:hypothetical protein